MDYLRSVLVPETVNLHLKGKTKEEIIDEMLDILVKAGKVVGELVERVIDSNYKLWQSFGGMYSLEMKNDRLQPSENSIKLVVHTMIHANRVNSVGDVE